MQITPELLADLKAKAKATTPGPWIIKVVASRDPRELDVSSAFFANRDNAVLTATASPKVILALIERIEKQEKEADWLAVQCATCADACSGTGVCNNGECGIENCYMGRWQDFREAARKAVEEKER